MKNEATKSLIENLKELSGKCRFVSFVYTSKSRGETARYTMLIGADYGKLTEKDILELEIRLQNATGIEKAVLQKLLDSRRETLKARSENRPHAFDTKGNQYVSICQGLRMNLNDNSLEICGTLESYVVLQAGTEKKATKHRSEETAMKAKIEKELPRSKWTTICFERTMRAKLNGETIELEPDIEAEEPKPELSPAQVKVLRKVARALAGKPIDLEGELVDYQGPGDQDCSN